MQSSAHHIGFLASPNTELLTPLLDGRLQVSTLTVLCENSELEHLQHLAGIATEAGVTVRHWPLQDDCQPSQIAGELEALLDECGQEKMVFNLSGATPAQAAVAALLAGQRDLPAFLVHPESDVLHWITAPAEFTDFNVADRLKLDDWLQARGFSVLKTDFRRGERVPPNRLIGAVAMCELVIERRQLYFQLKKALQEINSTTPHSHTRIAAPERINLLPLENHGLIQLHTDGAISTPSFEAHRFLQGGWLELLHFKALQELERRLPLQDYAVGAKIYRDEGVENELDVAILFNNHLYVVECKAFGRSPSTPAMEVVHRLAALSDDDLLSAEAMYSTTHQASENDEALSEQFEVELVAGRELARLSNRLYHWLSGR